MGKIGDFIFFSVNHATNRNTIEFFAYWLINECNGIIITWVTWLFEVCTDSVPRPSKCTEIVGGWGFAPDPTGGAYSAPPAPLAGLRGLLLRDLLLRGGEGRRGEGILLRNSFRGLVTPLVLGILLLKLQKNTNRKPHVVYRMVQLSMTLSDLWFRFQCRDIFSTLITSETSQDSYYSMLIGSPMRSIAWRYFQWPWRTPNPVFKVTAFLKSKMGRLRDKLSIQQ